MTNLKRKVYTARLTTPAGYQTDLGRGNNTPRLAFSPEIDKTSASAQPIVSARSLPTKGRCLSNWNNTVDTHYSLHCLGQEIRSQLVGVMSALLFPLKSKQETHTPNKMAKRPRESLGNVSGTLKIFGWLFLT